MARRRMRWLGVLAAATLVLAACGDDDDGGGSDATTTTAADGGSDEGAVTVTAVDNAFPDLPSEIEAGVFEFDFVNEGEADHEIAFVEVGEGVELDQFFTDFGPVIQEGGAFPDYVGSLVGANEAAAGETETYAYTLTEGTYVAFCALAGTPEDPGGEDGAPHFADGMANLVTVTAGEDAELSEGDGTITASDYTFEVDLEDGDTVINFTNEGPNDHFAGYDVYPEGTTAEEAEAAFGTLLTLEEGQAPPDDLVMSEEIGFSGIASEGNSVQFTSPQPFESGRTYVFYCFISDRTGGPPHAIGNQMFRAVTIE